MQTAAQAARPAPGYDPSAQYPVQVRDIEYHRYGDTPLHIRLYQPQGAGPFPLLLDIHGGAWTANDRTANEVMSNAIAASGMVIAAVDFRQAPDHQYPTSLEDINYAVRWAKARAAEWNADPRRMGFFGGSSGGHLACLAAMRHDHPPYATLPLADAADIDAQAAYVVACWPIVDPYARYLFAKETNKPELMKRTEGYFGSFEAMQEGSPQGLLDRGEAVSLPPVLIVQGTNDSNISVAIVERFVKSYRAAGGQCALELFEGQPHSFGNQPGEAAERAIARIKAFIAEQLG